MAEHGFNYGGRGGGSTGFLGLDQKYVAAIIIAAVLAMAILGAAIIMRPEPTPATPQDSDAASEIACLEGGGEWHPFNPFYAHGPGTCQH